MWALGRYDLNLTEEEFWGLTVRELNALTERQAERHDWLNYRAALICSVLANTARDPKRKRTPFTPDDFMPGKPRKEQSAQQMWATVKVLNASLGGNVLED